MEGISLDMCPEYHLSSYRCFAPHEHHITRVDPHSDILLIMCQGILRFRENGEAIELTRGEYYIQQKGLLQEGNEESDCPVYFYLHFSGQWVRSGTLLPHRGICSPDTLSPLLNELAADERANAPAVVKNGLFYTLLSELWQMQCRSEQDTLADRMARRLTENLRQPPTLETLAQEFHFSVNYLIRIFRTAKGVTPHAYLQSVRLKQACLLLDTTNATAEIIASECGFSDYAHFYRVFHRSVGKSPKEYRARAPKGRVTEV